MKKTILMLFMSILSIAAKAQFSYGVSIDNSANACDVYVAIYAKEPTGFPNDCDLRFDFFVKAGNTMSYPTLVSATSGAEYVTSSGVPPGPYSPSPNFEFTRVEMQYQSCGAGGLGEAFGSTFCGANFSGGLGSGVTFTLPSVSGDINIVRVY